MSANEKHTPIAIVGIGCLFPKAENQRRFWANIKNGVDAIGDVPASHWLPEEHFDKNPVELTQKLAGEGKIVIRPVKGGVMLYLPEDAPSAPKSVLLKILGPEEETP